MSFFNKKTQKEVTPVHDEIEADDNLDSKFEMELEDEESTLPKFIFDPDTNENVAVRYDYNFYARLSQGSSWVKENYDLIKNEMLKYKGIKTRLSWKFDSFNFGRLNIARLVVRRGVLTFYLALDPNRLMPKYKGRDSSAVTLYKKVPYTYSILNELRTRRVIELIDILAKTYGLEKKKVEPPFVKYSDAYPYQSDETLLKNDQIKIIKSTAKLKSLETGFLNYDFEVNEPMNVSEDDADTFNLSDVIYLDSRGHTYKTVVNKSFTAKLSQTQVWNKYAYQLIKNRLLQYEKLLSKITWNNELFDIKNELLIRISVYGNTLFVFFKLNPNDYIKKFGGKDITSLDYYKEMPYQLAILNTKRLYDSLELIDILMAKYGQEVTSNYTPKNYLRKFPNRTDDYFITHKLIKQAKVYIQRNKK